MKLCFTDELFARAAMFAVLLAYVPVADVEEIFYEIPHYIQTRFPKLTRRLTVVGSEGGFYEIPHYIQTRFPKLTRRLTFVSHCGMWGVGSEERVLPAHR